MLSQTELECVYSSVANHRAYLDQSFVRKLTARWAKVYKAVGGAEKTYAHASNATYQLSGDNTSSQLRLSTSHSEVRSQGQPTRTAGGVNDSRVDSRRVGSQASQYVSLNSSQQQHAGRPSTVPIKSWESVD